MVPFVLVQLGAFGLYTLGLIVLAGQAFDWKEDRKLFYLGDRKLSFLPGMATFCATWMSGTSVVGFTMWIYQEGYVAFTGSVLGWLLGLCLMPFFLKRLREEEALSLPELLEKIHGDVRLRYLGAVMIILVYLFYVIIQFRVFGSVVSELLHINSLGAFVMVYLFVVYTTFGGFPSVVRSDMLNMGIIFLGITVALGAVLLRGGNPFEMHVLLYRHHPEMLHLWSGKWQNPLLIFLMMLSWGMGVAANPQYLVRLMAADSPETAGRMVCVAPFLVGWMYGALTFVGIGAFLLAPGFFGGPVENLFVGLISSIMSPLVALCFFLAVVAATVSTANSQLLLLACSLCYDLLPMGRDASQGKSLPEIVREDRFLFANRLAIVLFATLALLLCQFRLATLLLLGHHSWTMVALCFFFPLLFRPSPRTSAFGAVLSGLILYALVTLAFGLPPELALIPSLLLEGALYHDFFTPPFRRAEP